MTKIIAQLLHKNYLNLDTLSLTFTLKNALTYQAGQFINILIPAQFITQNPQLPGTIDITPSKPTFRAYSIAQYSDQQLSIIIKVLPDGLGSHYLKQLTTADHISFTGPFGRFVNSTLNPPQRLYLATGTGLAPLLPMITESLAEKIPTTLLFGVRRHCDIFHQNILAQLNDDPNFSHHICISQEQHPDYLHGRITAHLEPYLNSQTEYYLCGSGNMINEVKTILIANQVPKVNINHEKFN